MHLTLSYLSGYKKSEESLYTEADLSYSEIKPDNDQ